ncbi:hypothetical protein MPLDJ20_110054 [Mesorhizobium plurifarium]|uniref:Uncharacterized protein n=1 Tax=Mesorhizobium plurifarium TaxID=69974 RepID=A0A090DRH6_MESPL|nr:hypothetical protein MPLDJ20_110054 [Mesorhizobium plurifarium]
MSVGDAGFLLQQNDELLVVNSTMGTAFTGFSHFKDPPVNRTGKIVEGFIAGPSVASLLLWGCPRGGRRESSASSRSSLIPTM